MNGSKRSVNEILRISLGSNLKKWLEASGSRQAPMILEAKMLMDDRRLKTAELGEIPLF
jgi:hypothetical protein